MTGGLDEERVAGPRTMLASPSLRRLRRKSSAEEAPPVVSPAAALLSPGSRRLRRKTSAEDDVPVVSTPLSGTPVGDAPARGPGRATLRRGRAGQAASRDSGRDGGSRGGADAAAWFLAAAEMDGSAEVSAGSRDVYGSSSAQARRSGVVSGFGSERTEDALGDQERRDREAITRARLRRDDAVRGRARDFQGNDLDRSIGGAWSLGRR